MSSAVKKWLKLLDRKYTQECSYFSYFTILLLNSKPLMEHLINMLTLCKVHCNWSSSEGEDLHAYWTF